MQFINMINIFLKDFILLNYFINKEFNKVSRHKRRYFCKYIGLVGIIVPLLFVNTFAATLTHSDNLEIRDIDDQVVEHGFFSKNKTFELKPGEHTIVLKYKDVFEDIEFAEDRVVKSDYFVVKFTVKNEQSLFLTTTPIRDLAAAQRFISAPELMMLNQNKQQLFLALEKLSDFELAKQVTKVVTSISMLENNKLLNEQKHINNKPTLEHTEELDKKILNEVDAVAMLKYWWGKATTEQKASFLQYIENEKNR